MAQFARPNADIVDGGWFDQDGSNVDMYKDIDEVTADDSTTYIRSKNDPVISDPVALDLSDVTDPNSSSDHIVRYRYSRNFVFGNPDPIDLLFELREGYVSEASQGTLIASKFHGNIGTSWTDGSFTLSAGEANSITDYSDLQIRILAMESSV